MLIYKCLFTGDEMFSDAYKVEKEGCFYKVTGALTTRKNDTNNIDFGANPSAEEQAEQLEDGVSESGINVVLDNRLQSTGFGTKKQYQLYMKDYIKKMKEKAKEAQPDRDMAEFEAAIASGFKKLLDAGFKDLEFYGGVSNDPEGSIAVVIWEQDQTVPCLYFWADGIQEVKV